MEYGEKIRNIHSFEIIPGNYNVHYQHNYTWKVINHRTEYLYDTSD